ncbi:MAG: pantoate--beta-alanine ligase [Alphaproteobacteria bacterium]|nr:pantoate--beta-alanine ligase [Alphaproteobacteria bacterium]
MKIVDSIAGLRAQVAAWRAGDGRAGDGRAGDGRVGNGRVGGDRVALVPTMGALHEGHVSLVEAARKHAGRVVVSIFVNPTQFAPHEDFDRYPRDLQADAAKLGGGTDLIFAPTVREMYPDGFATTVSVGGPSEGLETDFRPHFFAGVATVVAKLLVAAMPDVAVFGEKDWQQLQVIRRLVADLALPIEIVGAPIMREADGLAMSSRNAYLKPGERAVAGRMNVILREARDPGAAKQALLDAGFDSVDYVAVRDAITLGPASSGPKRILAAARIGGTRLIDNMEFAHA